MDKLVLTGLTHPGAFELEPGFNTLGRNPTNDFRVHDVTISSFHCEIVVSEDSVLVRDLGSTNGTFIDGQQIHEAELRPGQILRLGSAELRLDSQAVIEPASISIPELKAEPAPASDRKSTRLNSSHSQISYAVFCLKKKKEHILHVPRSAALTHSRADVDRA